MFKIKQGDTSPALEAQLIDPDGEPAPLSLATDVTFHFGESGGTLIVEDDLDGGVKIVDEDDGIVHYEWSQGETSDDGTYEAEFIVTYNTGEIRSYPNNEYITVTIKQDIANE